MLRLLFVCASFPTALALMALLLRLILFVYKTSKLCNVLRMIFLTVDSPTYVNKNEMLQESYAKSWKSKEVMCNKRGSVHSAVDCDRLLLMMLKMISISIYYLCILLYPVKTSHIPQYCLSLELKKAMCKCQDSPLP